MNDDFKLKVQESFSKMILSASGFRKIFASEEEDTSPEITEADKVLAYYAAISYVICVKNFLKKDSVKIVLSQDSRPTGRALATAIIQAFVHLKVEVVYLGITAIPEVLAYVKTENSIDGFFYVSASHNPVGYNGFKFGYNDGALLDSSACRLVIELYRKLISEFVMVNLNDNFPLYADEEAKHFSADVYQKLLVRTAWDSFPTSEHQALHNSLKHSISQERLGVLVDFNGSSRIRSIDLSYLTSIGVRTSVINNILGTFEHEILPEGSGLEQCRKELIKLNKEKSYYTLGYVPDCDGDRGNLVYFDNKLQKAEILEAQEVFSLCVLSELCYLKLLNVPMGQVAIICNDATSLRIKVMTDYFGAKTFVAETGEANVIALANKKREEGLIVRIMGEGSNGGNITYPCTVRDPLNTLTSIIKLLYLKIEDKSLFSVWLEISSKVPPRHFVLSDILNVMPVFSTTNVSNPKALLKTTSSPKVLKKNFEVVFKNNQTKVMEILKDLSVKEYKVYNYEGINTLEGFGNRTGDETGGFKIVFFNDFERECASMWFRGSKTEPITRCLVDIETHTDDIAPKLLDELRTMLEEADKMG